MISPGFEVFHLLPLLRDVHMCKQLTRKFTNGSLRFTIVRYSGMLVNKCYSLLSIAYKLPLSSTGHLHEVSIWIPRTYRESIQSVHESDAATQGGPIELFQKLLLQLHTLQHSPNDYEQTLTMLGPSSLSKNGY